MKKLWMTLFTLALCASAFAQVKQPAEEGEKKTSSTKLEAFLSKKGILLIRDIQSCGTVKGPADDFSLIGLAAVAAYQPGNEATKQKGFTCSMFRARGRGSSESSDCYIDVEEAESLSKALDYLSKSAEKLKGQTLGKDGEKQVFFITKADFKIGFTVSGEDGKLHPSATVGNIGRVRIEFTSTDVFTEMKTAIDKGLAWLKQQ